jgi:hypothetical protein
MTHLKAEKFFHFQGQAMHEVFWTAWPWRKSHFNNQHVGSHSSDSTASQATRRSTAAFACLDGISGDGRCSTSEAGSVSIPILATNSPQRPDPRLLASYWMGTVVNAAGIYKYRSFPSTVPRLRRYGPIPLAPKRFLCVESKYRLEHVATCPGAICEGVCAESFVCLSEVIQFYKNIVSLLGAEITQSV